jgi:pimeloyl-ACP methyl ester carboxylesterase
VEPATLLVNGTEQSIAAQVEFYSFGQGAPNINIDYDYLAHLNTPVLARDLELIRNLTAADTFNFLGFQHGAVTGLTYAALFPDRVGKMVLDGMSIFDIDIHLVQP